jgi:hypothetical protein
LEESIRREQRERETKMNAEELMKFLDFDDITEFNQGSTHAFEEKNFFAEDIATENVAREESYCHKEELKQDESIESMLQGLSDKSSQKHTNDATQDGTIIECRKFDEAAQIKCEPLLENRTYFEEGKNS